MEATMTKGLGKGLSALMAEGYSNTTSVDMDSPSGDVMKNVPIGNLVSGKFQPRYRFTAEYLEELTVSIRKNGIMQPIVVRDSIEHHGKFEIIAGERRWRAAKLAKLTEVPVIIREIADQQAMELALVENIQRQDLTALEEAAGYQRLIDEFSYTQEELSKTVGKSRSHIANLLRLQSLPNKIKQYLDEDILSMGHARALLSAKNPEELAEEVIKRGLNVRQTENLCRSILPVVDKKKKSNNKSSIQEKDSDIIALENTLSENLGLRVTIDDREGKEGKITISYDYLSQLDKILQLLSGGV